MKYERLQSIYEQAARLRLVKGEYAQLPFEYAQLAPLYAQLHCRYAQLPKSTKKQPSQKGQLSSAFLFDFSKAWYRKAKTFSNTSPEFRIRFVQVADLAKFDVFFCNRA